jgi:DNA-binding response OmpR family regulator
MDKIFERFYQVDDAENIEIGTGIGLSLTKELVELHGGKISVDSVAQEDVLGQEESGTKFVILLPLVEQQAEYPRPEKDVGEENDLNSPVEYAPGEDGLPFGASKKKVILIVEDNKDLRLFVHNELAPCYHVIEASDGLEGKQKAIELVPDLILCDVMMPGMDGIELMQVLKKEQSTNHIPVILLTAKSSEEYKIKGLGSGADDYITKPFNMDVLVKKMENILQIRSELKEKFSREVTLQPTNVKLESLDEKFLEKAMKIVEKNMEDPEFSVDEFSRAIGISRMQLYRKLEALTGQTVKEFIKSIRLKRAAQLLVQKQLTVSEIAYHVGFSEVSYFRKCFKKQFNLSPTEYIDTEKG